MAKFLIGLVTGAILTILFGVVIVFSLARFGTEKRVTVPDNPTLILRLEGDIPERPPMEYPIPFFEQHAASTFKDVLELLRKASGDSPITALVFQPPGMYAA